MNTARILVAGIGNIFLGDDAFGVEVVRALSTRPLPEAVRLKDFGTRGYDLAYALIDGYEAIILVDATSRGEAPGTVYLIEPSLERESAHLAPGGHGLTPEAVIQLAHALSDTWAEPRKVYLVGCEPGRLESEDGQMGLSQPVAAALPAALDLIQNLLTQLLNLTPPSQRNERNPHPVRTEGVRSHG